MPAVPDLPRRRTTRLLLLCHAETRATRQAAFPLDEPVEEKGLAAASRLARCLPQFALIAAAPALCARQTADALGVAAETEQALRDCDWGTWRGQTLDALAACEPEAVRMWLADPETAPHGGESIAALISRVGGWLDGRGLAGRALAVTHPAVIRAALVHALRAPASCFWGIDVRPLSVAELGHGAGQWRLRTGTALQPPLKAR